MSSYPVVRMVECPHCRGKVRADDTKCRWCQSLLKVQQPTPVQGTQLNTMPQKPAVSWTKLDQAYREHLAWKTLVSPGQSIIVIEGEGAAQVQGGNLVKVLPYGTSSITDHSSSTNLSKALGVVFTKTGLQTINWGQSEMATADGILVGASGTIRLRQSDPAKLLSIFPVGQSYLSQKDLKAVIFRLIGPILEEIISQVKWLNLLTGGKKRLAEAIMAQTRAQLSGLGLELSDLEVSSVMLPDELRRALKERGIKELETRAELEKLEEMRRAGYDVNKIALMDKMAAKGGGVHLIEGNYVQGTNISAEDSVFVRSNFSGKEAETQPTVECPKCRATMEASRRVCNNCGTKFLVCQKDWTAVIADPTAKFCHQCGGLLV